MSFNLKTIYRRLGIVAAFFLLVNMTQAQESQSYLDEPIKERPFDKAKWQKAIKDVSFEDKQIKDPEFEEKKDEEKSQGLSPAFKKALTAFAMGLLIIFLGFVVLKLVTGKFWIGNPKIKKRQNAQREFTVEEVEENLHESDLDIFLRQTLANKSYKLAIRVYYLMIIKELSLSDFIRWKKDKTNREYLNEMRAHSTFDNFRDLTRTFERVWYGDYDIGHDDFSKIGPRFEQYVKTIRA